MFMTSPDSNLPNSFPCLPSHIIINLSELPLANIYLSMGDHTSWSTESWWPLSSRCGRVECSGCQIMIDESFDPVASLLPSRLHAKHNIYHIINYKSNLIFMTFILLDAESRIQSSIGNGSGHEKRKKCSQIDKYQGLSLSKYGRFA